MHLWVLVIAYVLQLVMNDVFVERLKAGDFPPEASLITLSRRLHDIASIMLQAVNLLWKKKNPIKFPKLLKYKPEHATHFFHNKLEWIIIIDYSVAVLLLDWN